MSVHELLRRPAARAGVVGTVGLVAALAVGCGGTGGTVGDASGPLPSESSGATSELVVTAVDPQDPRHRETVDRAAATTDADDPRPVVLRSDAPEELLVVTRGSSSCPVTPRAARWVGDTVVLEVASFTAEDAEREGTDRVCTDDLAPAVFAVSVPDLPDDPLDVAVERVELVASSELPGRATARPEG
ncbi:hypothetical protein [Cellulosimicrobium sp. Marseille-Q8652]